MGDQVVSSIDDCACAARYLFPINQEAKADCIGPCSLCQEYSERYRGVYPFDSEELDSSEGLHMGSSFFCFSPTRRPKYLVRHDRFMIIRLHPPRSRVCTGTTLIRGKVKGQPSSCARGRVCLNSCRVDTIEESLVSRLIE